MSSKLSKKEFYNALTKVLKLKPFFLETSSYEDVFSSFFNDFNCRLMFKDEIIVWEERIPILSSALSPTPSCPLIKTLMTVRDSTFLISDMNMPMKDSLFLCMLTPEIQQFNLEALNKRNTRLTVANFQEEFLVCIELQSVIRFTMK